MRFLRILLVVLGCGVGAVSAAEPAGRLIRESWDAAFLDGEKAGHFHTIVNEQQLNGRTVITVTRELTVSVRRQGQIAMIQAQTGDEESLDGKLLGVWMTQKLGTNLQVKLSGRVVDGVLKDTLEGSSVPGNKVERAIKIPDDTLTFSAEETILKTRKAKPGERFSYRLFEPFANTVVRVEVTVKEREKVSLNGVNRLLLRAEAKPEKIGGVQLPSQTLWYDDEYNLVISQGEIPGLGELTLRRTTEQQAKAPLGRLRDLGDLSIALDKTISDPHRARKIVYRVNFTKDLDDLANSFSVGDDRQEIKNVSENSLELHVTAVRTAPKKPSNELISKEYLDSNFFIASDDDTVQRHARNAVGDERDPWQKALAIERWVKRNMKPMVFTEAMAPADHVARTMTGDCTEFAMLAAAMCRAQGIPSRTAIGAVYYLDKGQPRLGYHMWTEVCIRGQWLGIDATLGYGSIGPAHVKITDASWHDVRSMIPLMPVMKVTSGKPRMEVIRVERD